MANANNSTIDSDQHLGYRKRHLGSITETKFIISLDSIRGKRVLIISFLGHIICKFKGYPNLL
jgi:hypothetical protein